MDGYQHGLRMTWQAARWVVGQLAFLLRICMQRKDNKSKKKGGMSEPEGGCLDSGELSYPEIWSFGHAIADDYHWTIKREILVSILSIIVLLVH